MTDVINYNMDIFNNPIGVNNIEYNDDGKLRGEEENFNGSNRPQERPVRRIIKERTPVNSPREDNNNRPTDKQQSRNIPEVKLEISDDEVKQVFRTQLCISSIFVEAFFSIYKSESVVKLWAGFFIMTESAFRLLGNQHSNNLIILNIFMIVLNHNDLEIVKKMVHSKESKDKVNYSIVIMRRNIGLLGYYLIVDPDNDIFLCLKIVLAIQNVLLIFIPFFFSSFWLGLMTFGKYLLIMIIEYKMTSVNLGLRISLSVLVTFSFGLYWMTVNKKSQDYMISFEDMKKHKKLLIKSLKWIILNIAVYLDWMCKLLNSKNDQFMQHIICLCAPHLIDNRHLYIDDIKEFNFKYLTAIVRRNSVLLLFYFVIGEYLLIGLLCIQVILYMLSDHKFTKYFYWVFWCFRFYFNIWVDSKYLIQYQTVDLVFWCYFCLTGYIFLNLLTLSE
jgi:hypothetical protein